MKWLSLDDRKVLMADAAFTVLRPATTAETAAPFDWVCNRKSEGYFYYNPHSNVWYFEHKEDALIFALTWGT